MSFQCLSFVCCFARLRAQCLCVGGSFMQQVVNLKEKKRVKLAVGVCQFMNGSNSMVFVQIFVNNIKATTAILLTISEV